jgi:N-acetylmuramoyl-L-alanine amidase
MKRGWTKGRVSVHGRNMSAALIAFAALFTGPDAYASGISRVDVEGNTVVVRFDGTVEKASTIMLDGPQRIAVDINGAEKGSNAAGAGVVTQIRQAQYDANTARVVFDLNQPAVVAGGQFAADGRSLTLSLNPVDAANFSAASRAPRKLYLPPVAHRSAPPRSRYSVTIPLGAAARGLPKPRIYGPAGRPLVVIDAGHGGHDPGTISPHGGVYEKDIVLGIARKIRDDLVKSGRVRVALTREDDRFLILRERTALARNLGAQLFISVHADSAGSADAAGASIYTLSEIASDREAQKLANRENKADILNGVNLSGENNDVTSILVDLAQRETMNASSNFATILKRESNGLVPFRTGFHRMADLAVLKAPDMPAVLMEVGYVTNEQDVARIASAEGQKRIAAGVRKAVEIHFARRLAIR